MLPVMLQALVAVTAILSFTTVVAIVGRCWVGAMRYRAIAKHGLDAVERMEGAAREIESHRDAITERVVERVQARRA